MAKVQRLLADTDGIRLTDTDGAYLSIPGELAEAVPPGTPVDIRYDREQQRLSWKPVPNAVQYRVFESRQMRAVRAAVATLAFTETTYDLPEGVGPDEHASWQVRAYDDYIRMESSPSRPAFFAGKNQK